MNKMHYLGKSIEDEAVKNIESDGKTLTFNLDKEIVSKGKTAFIDLSYEEFLSISEYFKIS